MNLHLSRTAVFHSSALLVSGAFLLLVAGAGYYVRYIGGDWGRALQIELLFAAALFVALGISSGRFRSQLKIFVSKHFFSYRYDYRDEWLRFTRTLATESGAEHLQVRTIRALADLLESPAGTLWLRNDAGAFVQAARWNTSPNETIEAADGSLATFLHRTQWIVDVPEYRRDPSRYPGLLLPPWLEATGSPWLVNPLIVGTELLGFVILLPPRAALEIDWEVRDLLKTASRQAASFLSHARATEALLEARKFDAFNRMSAFVVHDLKNLISQLSLMLTNAQRHRNNPDFQADMLATVKHVVERMNRLTLQLRAGSEPVESARHVDIVPVLRRLCSASAGCGVRIEVESTAPGAMALGHEDRLEHVVSHLLQNAIDATPATGLIRMRIDLEERFVVVVLSDTGAGMTPEFVRDRLFRPFETTKESGMGIGVYESNQYVSGLGGSLEVDSQPGIGTTVRIRLPRAQPATAVDAPVIKEQVA